jgi:hypothetical protein
MISPTIGRVVLYWPPAPRPDKPHAALVCDVHGDRLINVGGFRANGQPFAHTQVQLLQDDDVAPESDAFCAWPSLPTQASAVTSSTPTPNLDAIVNGLAARIDDANSHIENVDMRVNALEGWKNGATTGEPPAPPPVDNAFVAAGAEPFSQVPEQDHPGSPEAEDSGLSASTGPVDDAPQPDAGPTTDTTEAVAAAT